METPFLKGTHDIQVHWIPGQSEVSIGIWVKPDCSSWRTSGKTGVNVTCGGGRTLKAKLSRIFSSCLSLEGAILGKSGPTHQLVAEKPQGKQQSRWDHSPTPQ